MTESELIDLMNGDLPIGIKEFVAMHDQAILNLTTLKIGYNHDQLDYIAEYIRFLEDKFMEEL